MEERSAEPLDREQRERLRALADLPDEQIDVADVPGRLDWSGARRDSFAYVRERKNSGKASTA
jgi:hypothetical protein